MSLLTHFIYFCYSCFASAGKPFTSRLLGLCDLYDVVKEGSEQLQMLQSLPWERQEGFRKMVLRLDCMRDALNGEGEMQEYWPRLASVDDLDEAQVNKLMHFTYLRQT